MRDLIIQQVFPATLTEILDSDHPEDFVHTAVMNIAQARLTLLYGDGSVALIDLAFFGQADFRTIEIQDSGRTIWIETMMYSVGLFKIVDDERIQVKE